VCKLGDSLDLLALKSRGRIEGEARDGMLTVSSKSSRELTPLMLVAERFLRVVGGAPKTAQRTEELLAEDEADRKASCPTDRERRMCARTRGIGVRILGARRREEPWGMV